MTYHDIGWAVKQMWDGNRVRRAGWDMWIAIERSSNEDRLPYVSLTTATGKLVPWTCSQADLLALDWESEE